MNQQLFNSVISTCAAVLVIAGTVGIVTGVIGLVVTIWKDLRSGK